MLGTYLQHWSIIWTAVSTLPAGTDLEDSLLAVALLQSPVHIYSIFASRSANEHFLDQGTSEHECGFGQIVAMVLLTSNILPVIDGIDGKLFSCVRIQ